MSAAAAFTEWGVLWPDGEVEDCFSEQRARDVVRLYGMSQHAQVVTRTVTYSEWVTQ